MLGGAADIAGADIKIQAIRTCLERRFHVDWMTAHMRQQKRIALLEDQLVAGLFDGLPVIGLTLADIRESRMR